MMRQLDQSDQLRSLRSTLWSPGDAYKQIPRRQKTKDMGKVFILIVRVNYVQTAWERSATQHRPAHWQKSRIDSMPCNPSWWAIALCNIFSKDFLYRRGGGGTQRKGLSRATINLPAMLNRENSGVRQMAGTVDEYCNPFPFLREWRGRMRAPGMRRDKHDILSTVLLEKQTILFDPTASVCFTIHLTIHPSAQNPT